MSGDGWIVVPNWDKFQHYQNRNPVWIKLYTELGKRDEWRNLTLAARGLLVSIWIEYAASDGLLRQSDVHARVSATTRPQQLNSLREAGYIRIRASKPLALRKHPRQRKREKTPKPPFQIPELLKDIEPNPGPRSRR